MTMTEWQRRETAEREALAVLVGELADELAAQGFGTWAHDVKPDNWGGDLTRDAARLFVSFDRGAPEAKRRDRLVITASYPHGTSDRYRYGDESDHQRRQVKRWEITVATSRGVPTIAKEIGRRLLSAGYLADLQAILQWQAEHEAYNDRAMALATELAAVIGVEVNGGPEHPSLHWYSSQARGGYGDARVSADGVYFDRMSVDAEQARKILAILAGK